MTTPRARPALPSRRRAAGGVFLLMTCWALLCQLVLKASVWWGQETWATPFLFTPTYLVGLAFLLTVILWLWALTGRAWIALSLSLALSLLLSVATLVKLDTLREPVVPHDISYVLHPQLLMTGRAWAAAGALVVVICSSGVLIRGASMRYRTYADALRSGRRAGKVRMLRLTVVVVAGALILSAGNFNRAPLNPWGALAGATQPDWRPWDQLRTYQLNGFVAGFLYNMPVDAMEEPDDYSASAMRRLAQRHSVPSPVGRERHPNIVVVLSEAFTDPASVDGYELDHDVIPHIRRVMAGAWSGRITNSAFGHGTSAAEFEVLTSQVIGLFEPRMTTPYQMLLPGMDHYASVVDWAEARDYRTTAIHPYDPHMYRRIPVYEALGFDEFLYEGNLRHERRLQRNPFISDESALDEVLDTLRTSEDPSLVHLVTMQNHFPTDNVYEDPVGVSGVTDDAAAAIGGYARGLSYTDAAVHEFLGRLTKLEEPTVVVFFGDHHPPIYGEEVLEANDEQTLLETPFFIWSSRGSPGHRDLGVISPTRLLPLAFEQAGMARPLMHRVAERFGTEVGALSRSEILTATGRSTDEESLDAADRRVLRDMRLLQYDLSVGDGHLGREAWQ